MSVSTNHSQSLQNLHPAVMIGTDFQRRTRLSWQLAALLHRLAYVRNKPCAITPKQVFSRFTSYGWACPTSGVIEAETTPLTVRWIIPLENGGKATIDNVTPLYHRHTLPGEYNMISKWQRKAGRIQECAA